MKKIIALFISFLLIFLATACAPKRQLTPEDYMKRAANVGAATRMYGRINLIGGTKSVDNIAYAGLLDGDLCIVITDAKILYFYRWESSATAAEDSPWVIEADDDGGGNGRWELITALALGRTSGPSLIFRDDDCTDDDINVRVRGNCPDDQGSGTEDCDFYIDVQINGVLTNVLHIDADGNAEFPQSN